MRKLIFFISLCSLNAFACIPCDKDASKVIFKVPKPKFPKGFYSEHERGFVKYKIGNGNSKSEKVITIIELTPADIPKESVISMLSGVEYRSVVKKDHQSICIDSFDFETEFELPQKVEIINTVEITIPNIKINYK